ncbi:Hypothetical protein SCF082_LOCUS41913 [Durusdinium trenchii]|uniref:Uncharacterized protein n=1 Tax=Durusdinium trenchii TaxID=1381693 RepID=A0ABP0QM92_9DINO
MAATLLRRVPNLCRDAAHFSKQADARLRRALDDLEAAQPKLEESEAQINDLLHGQVMKVRFALPRLEPESFQEVLAQVDQYKDAHLQLRQARTSSLLEGEANSRSMADGADLQEELRGVVRSMREMGFASAMSLAVLMALSYSSMDLRVASLISGIFSMLVQFVAFAQTWSKQVSWMFQAFNGATSRMISTLDEPVARYGQKVAQPLEALESAIDRLDMEQALVMKRMKEFEGQVREAIPDFDVPSVEEMREPIVDCHGQIGSFLEETKGALPEELQELIGRHPMGKLVWQRASFECRFVHFPLILVFLLNLGLLILCQVAVCHAMEHPVATVTTQPNATWDDEMAMSSSLRSNSPSRTLVPADLQHLLPPAAGRRSCGPCPVCCKCLAVPWSCSQVSISPAPRGYFCLWATSPMTWRRAATPGSRSTAGASAPRSLEPSARCISVRSVSSLSSGCGWGSCAPFC